MQSGFFHFPHHRRVKCLLVDDAISESFLQLSGFLPSLSKYCRSSSTSLLAFEKLAAKEEFIAAERTNPKVNSLLGM